MMKFVMLAVWTIVITMLTIAGTACYQDAVRSGKEIKYAEIQKCFVKKLTTAKNYTAASRNLVKNAPYGDRILRAAQAWNADDNTAKNQTTDTAEKNAVELK